MIQQQPFADNFVPNQTVSQAPVAQDQFPLIDNVPLNIPRMQVREKCDSVKKQAVEIANAILMEQYQKLFQFLSKYLKSSSYLVQMTQVRNTRNLRRHLFRIMSAFGRISESNVEFLGEMTDNMSENQIDQEMSRFDQQMEEEEKRPKVDDFINKI